MLGQQEIVTAAHGQPNRARAYNDDIVNVLWKIQIMAVGSTRDAPDQNQFANVFWFFFLKKNEMHFDF
jgi:hypothetical protein